MKNTIICKKAIVNTKDIGDVISVLQSYVDLNTRCRADFMGDSNADRAMRETYDRKIEKLTHSIICLENLFA